MPDNQTFIDFHEALMRLSHSQAFMRDRRDKKLAALTKMCATLLDIERVSVWQLSTDDTVLSCEMMHELEQTASSTTWPRFQLREQDHPAYFRAIKAARVIEACDAQTDARTSSFAEHYLKPLGVQSMMDAPVFDGGRLSGVVCLEAKHRRVWTLPELSFLTAISDTVSLINTHEAWLRSKQKLDYITHFDSLTGLANLQSLRTRIDYLLSKIARHENGSFAVVWIDLDRLKVINDGMGPQIGDQVISETGNRLRALSIPGKDQLARIGGDEFALVLRNYSSRTMLDTVIQRIIADISQPITIGGQSLSISASLGICHFPGDGDSAESLLRSAEAAMYHAKHQGRGQACEFDTSIHTNARSRFALERQLRTAIQRDGLDVFYQPILDAKTRNIVSLEALVRWQHPEQGWLAPLEFLDVARSAGLMFGLGQCVLRRVCRDRSMAAAQDICLPVMTINLASEQVLDPVLPGLVSNLCAEYGIAQSELHFEVTEDSIQGDSRVLKTVLDQLVAGGSELAIDDFGTGYSSLSRLKHLPFSKLKIDRSFIHDLPHDEDDCAITLSILGLARGLGLSVVAEGVENAGHEEWLNAKGCDYLQGYKYSRPIPLDELIATFFSRQNKVSAGL